MRKIGIWQLLPLAGTIGRALRSRTSSYPGLYLFIGVEDKENWHGKPLPKDVAEQTIKEMESKIQSKKKLSPALPVEDAPSISIKNIKMPSPPNFKLGEKVGDSLS